MIGDEGPYIEMAGPIVWVPRTVPYHKAWAVARCAVQEWDQHVAYRGKEDAVLFGFVRDCQCDEECELLYGWNDATAEDEATGDRTCYVPAWRFEIVEDAR